MRSAGAFHRWFYSPVHMRRRLRDSPSQTDITHAAVLIFYLASGLGFATAVAFLSSEGVLNLAEFSWRETFNEFREGEMVSQATLSKDGFSAARTVTVRYKDAYKVARIVTTIGGIIKGFGIALGVIVFAVVFFAASPGPIGRPVPQVAVIPVAGLAGLFSGMIFYFLGLVVSSQGQMLKATLDHAVHTSPFLTDPQRMDVMGLL